MNEKEVVTKWAVKRSPEKASAPAGPVDKVQRLDDDTAGFLVGQAVLAASWFNSGCKEGGHKIDKVTQNVGQQAYDQAKRAQQQANQAANQPMK